MDPQTCNSQPSLHQAAVLETLGPATRQQPVWNRVWTWFFSHQPQRSAAIKTTSR